MTYEELLKLKAHYSTKAHSPEKQPAMPNNFVLQDGSQVIYTGMDVLTVVATAAMKGLMSNPVFVYNNTGHTPAVTMDYDLIAAMSVSAAKALISEIEKSK